MKQMVFENHQIQVGNQKDKFQGDKTRLGEMGKTCQVLTILEYTERTTIQYMTKIDTYLRHHFQGASIQTNTKRHKRYYMGDFEGTTRY